MRAERSSSIRMPQVRELPMSSTRSTLIGS